MVLALISGILSTLSGIQIPNTLIHTYPIIALNPKNRVFVFTIAILQCFITGNTLLTSQVKHFNQRSHWYTDQPVDCIAQVSDIDFIEKQQKVTLNTIFTRKASKKWLKCNDNVTIYTYKKNIQVGNHLYIHAMKSMAPTKDLKKILLQRNIVATSFQVKHIKITRRPTFSLKRIVHTIKNNIKNSLQKKLSKTTSNLFFLIFLGKKDGKGIETRSNFSWWGIIHYMARSGLHVMLLFIIINTSLSLLRLPHYIKNVCVLALCVLYHILTWPSTSFIRALIIVICCQLCKIMKIPINITHLLHIAILICLLYNPASLFALDFQLTFALTYTLIITNKQLPRVFKKTKTVDY